MVFIASDEIERYAEAHTTPPSDLLVRLVEETRADLRSPTMLSGAVAGRLLELIVFALRPERVLELGTYSGYSAISMASVLPPGGHIDTCEVDETHAAVARRYLDEAGLGDRVTVHLGPALEAIGRLEGEFDLIFVDADKVSYPAYYDALLPRLSARGIMVLDNTLWSGRVVDDPAGSPETRMFVELNERIASDPNVVAVVLTVRDGITLLRKS
jgi:caffeoyl-CoA O-methyltransferase